jgi:prepilin-type N-terminal cleavage/methylation domain-containing protein
MGFALSYVGMAKRQAGFTLIEMMIVITVMGTMAALLAPGIGEYIADARATAASEGLVRVSRHVRARAQETGLAHLLIFGNTKDAAGAYGLGRMLVYEGMNNHCRQTPWGQATAANGAANGHAPVEALDLGDTSYNPRLGGTANPTVDDLGRHVVGLSAADGLAAYTFCFEPSGAIWLGTPDATPTSGFKFARQVRPVTFSVRRTLNGTARGVTRNVVFQPGGIARFSF